MRPAHICLFLLFTATAVAQPRPVFDPDDFVNPQFHDGPVFISRLVAGVAFNLVDDYRPLKDTASFLYLANSFYWARFQVDYKRSEVRANDPPKVVTCGCSPPLFFPTPPLRNETPEPAPAGSRDILQVGWYFPLPRPGRDPIMLRMRASWTRQDIDTPIHSPATGAVVSRLSGREQSFGLETDTFIRLGKYDHFGTLVYAVTSRHGTIDDRRRHEVAYSSRFPALTVRDVLFVPALTVGGISDRGGTAINLIHPQFEAIWEHRRTNVNVHLVYSPQFLNDGANGWKAHHQIALFADRALFVKLFR